MSVLEQFLKGIKEEDDKEKYFYKKDTRNQSCLEKFLSYDRNDASTACVKLRVQDTETGSEHKETSINIDKDVSVIEIINEHGLNKEKCSITINIY